MMWSISISYRLGLAFHALNNEGSDGSNLMQPRRIDVGKVTHDGMARPKRHSLAQATAENVGSLIWLRAAFEFHSFSYRDPRSPSSAAIALPLVSPTAVLLGICSTLYELGLNAGAEEFLKTIHLCQVRIDPPGGAIFFRAFHELRRYFRSGTKKKGEKPSPRIGFTDIGQGTREYSLLQGSLTLYIGVLSRHKELVAQALRNRNHLGTHDSLCSLVGDVEQVDKAPSILYRPLSEGGPIPNDQPTAVVTLSRFVSSDFGDASVGPWRMSGGRNTELVPFVIPGQFTGTRNGKIYRKRV